MSLGEHYTAEKYRRGIDRLASDLDIPENIWILENAQGEASTFTRCCPEGQCHDVNCSAYRWLDAGEKALLCFLSWDAGTKYEVGNMKLRLVPYETARKLALKRHYKGLIIMCSFGGQLETTMHYVR